MLVNKPLSLFVLLTAATVLAGCQADDFADSPYYTLSENKADTPLSNETRNLIRTKGMREDAPIMIRIIKDEDKLEVWKELPTGRYAHLKDYEICAWSGEFGRKKKEGDRQAPEGFYHITPALMNPYSSYFLAFNTGFPNKYDRAHGFTGSHLMVHGACSSRGCYSMTDEQIGEIYALAREAFEGGQKSFQMQAIPFRLTPENLAKHHDHPEFDFWLNLKEGMDHFEATKVPPAVDVCDKRYVYNAVLNEGERLNARAACPVLEQPLQIASAVRQIQEVDNTKLAKLVERAEKRKEREIARQQRQQRLEQALSFGQRQSDPDADTSNVAAVSADGADSGPLVSNPEGLPVPRPRPGSQVAAAEPQRGFSFGRFFGGRDRTPQAEQPAPVAGSSGEATSRGEAITASAQSEPSQQASSNSPIEANDSASAGVDAASSGAQVVATSETQVSDGANGNILLQPGRWLRAFRQD